MANAVFPKAKEGFLDGSIDLDTAVIKVALVRGYTYSSSHSTVSDVTGAGATLHATSGALSSKAVTNGVFDAADVNADQRQAPAFCPAAGCFSDDESPGPLPNVDTLSQLIRSAESPHGDTIGRAGDIR